MAAGQYLGTGGLTMIGQLVPMLQGVGYATMTIVFWLGMTANQLGSPAGLAVLPAAGPTPIYLTV